MRKRKELREKQDVKRKMKAKTNLEGDKIPTLFDNRLNMGNNDEQTLAENKPFQQKKLLETFA